MNRSAASTSSLRRATPTSPPPSALPTLLANDTDGNTDILSTVLVTDVSNVALSKGDVKTFKVTEPKSAEPKSAAEPKAAEPAPSEAKPAEAPKPN